MSKKVVKKTTTVKTEIFEETTGEKTLIVSVLDRSGSMRINNLIDDAIGGYNQFLEDQKKLEDEATMTTILFDDNYELLFSNIPVGEVVEFTHATWTPRGMTRLHDAVGKTIADVKSEIAKLKKKNRPDKVLVCIVTDGGENDSREYNADTVKKMIKECEKEGWSFIYLGANQDAFAEGTAFGISAGNTFTFTADAVGMDNVSMSLNNAATYYRSASVDSPDFAVNSSTLMDDHGVTNDEDNKE